MCLDLEIELPLESSGGAIGARRLSRESGLRVAGFHTAEGHRRFHFARGKECSCSLLADDGFESDATEWPLAPDAALALARAVSLIAANVRHFMIRTEWLGVERREPVSLTMTTSQVLETLRGGRLPANAVVQVQGKR